MSPEQVPEVASEFVFYSDAVLLHNQGQRTPFQVRVDMLEHLRRVYEIQGEIVSQEQLEAEAREVIFVRYRAMENCTKGAWRRSIRSILETLLPSQDR